MYLLALRLAELRGTLPRERLTAAGGRPQAPAALHRRDARGAHRGGRRTAPRTTAPSSSSTSAATSGSPLALEGALKLKEISYIATDAYAAGEMKHGPIALLDEATPVVVVATESPVLEKVVSNMQEVRARGAHVIAVATEGTSTSASTPRRCCGCRRPTGCSSRSSP